MLRIIKHILRVANTLVLCALPLVYPITKSLYWTVADPQLSFNNSGLCWWFIFPVISMLALIVLLRKKLGAELYCKQIEGLNQNQAVLDVFWFVQFLLWAAAAVFMAYKMLTNTNTWDLNWNYCAMSLAYSTPAMVIHLVELLYKWWPLIKDELTTENHWAIRILLVLKTLLFRGIGARETPLEKIIHTIRVLYWSVMVAKVVCSLPSVFLFTAVSLYESFYLKFGVVIGMNYLFVGGLRLIELIFVDND